MFQIKGTQAIKNHPFFKEIDWAKLAQKKIDPPLIPTVTDELDTQHFDEEFTKMNFADSMNSSANIIDNDDQRMTRARNFSSFSYDAENDKV